MSRCRLEATGDRHRGAHNLGHAKNPGCRGKEFQRMHAPKSAKPFALQQKSKKSKKTGLVQRVAIWLAHHTRVRAARWSLPKRRAVFFAFIASPCAAGDLEEKPPCILWNSLGSAGGFFPSASRQRDGWALFAACRPHRSNNGVRRSVNSNTLDTTTHSRT